MRSTLCGALMFLAISPAVAEPRYDVKLEQAAMDVIAGKIGGIRSGFDYRHTVSDNYAAMSRRSAPIGGSWHVAAPEMTKSTTVGSIQTYSGQAPAQTADTGSLTARSGRKLPHILKF